MTAENDMTVGRVIRHIEEVLEKANMLTMELAIRSVENEEITGRITRTLDFEAMAERAYEATDTISRLVRELRSAPGAEGNAAASF